MSQSGKPDDAKETAVPKRAGRFGARRGAMLLCTYIWTLFAVGSLSGAVTTVPNAFHLLLSDQWRFALWIASAALAVVMAVLPEKAYIGLAGLAVMPMFTMLSYGWSWLSYVFTGDGSPRGWYLASFYLAAVGLVVISAFIPDAKHRDRSAIAIIRGS